MSVNVGVGVGMSLSLRESGDDGESLSFVGVIEGVCLGGVNI